MPYTGQGLSLSSLYIGAGNPEVCMMNGLLYRTILKFLCATRHKTEYFLRYVWQELSTIQVLEMFTLSKLMLS